MKILLTLRHGDAIPGDVNNIDKQRPLSEKGKKELKRLRKQEPDLFQSIDLILCSSSTRTRQTLDCIMKGLPDRVMICYLDNLYDSSVDTLIQEISLVDNKFNSIMLVGHNPELTTLMNRVCEHQELPMDKSMTTGSIGEFTVKNESWQNLTVKDLKFMRLITPKKQVICS
jgi:phosphohistidine phosphatase